MRPRIAKALLLAGVVGAVLFGPAGLRHEPQSAEAAQDFSLDMVAAGPTTYVHQGVGEGNETDSGSLQFDSRKIGTAVVESLEAQDFACRDRIVFFTRISVDSQAQGTQTIEIAYDFQAQNTGDVGIGYKEVLAIGLSANDFAGQTQESGATLSGNESVTLLNQVYSPGGNPPGGDFGTSAATNLLFTIEVDGLEAGESVVARTDVRIDCFAPDPMGTLVASLISASVTSGGQGTIDVGFQAVPMLGVAGLGPPPPPAFRLPWRVEQEGGGWRLGTSGLHPSPGTAAIDFIHESAVGQGCNPIDISIDIAAVGPGTVGLPNPNEVHVVHPSGWTSVYFHVANIAVSDGQVVTTGTPLGNPSCLGGGTVKHVHFTMKEGGTWSPMVNDMELCGWRIQNDTNGDGIEEFVRGGVKIEVNNRFANISCARGVSVQDTLLFPGQTTETPVTMESAQSLSTFAVFWTGSTVDLTLVAPDGTEIDSSTLDPNIFHSKGDTYELYDIASPQAGDWTIRLYGADVPPVGEQVEVYFMSCPAEPGDAAGDPCVGDDDQDGCTDVQELGQDETLGGLRDPLNPWDFYDVLGPGAALPTDGIIDLPNDILGVIQHFAPQGQAPYDVNFDRGPSSGPNPWNMTAPDGVIDLPNDILGVILQFGHRCV